MDNGQFNNQPGQPIQPQIQQQPMQPQQPQMMSQPVMPSGQPMQYQSQMGMAAPAAAKGGGMKLLAIIVAVVAVVGGTWLFLTSDKDGNPKQAGDEKKQVQSGKYVEMTKSDREILAEAFTNMQNVHSGNVKIGMVMGIEGQSVSISADADYDKDLNMHMTLAYSMMGLNIEMEAYYTQDGDQSYTYMNTFGMWTYEVGQSESIPVTLTEMEVIAALHDDYKDVKQHSEKVNGATRYELTLSDKAKLDLAGELSSEDEITQAMIDYDKDFVIDVYVKDGYVVKLVIDFGTFMSNEFMSEHGFTEYSINLEFSEFNEVGTITVPESVKQAATKAEDPDFNF